MSQFDFGTIDPSATSGPGLAVLLGNFRTALNSTHKGATAPTYKIAGTIWLDDTTTPWYLKIYDGADWITIGSVNASGNVFGTRFAKGANVASAAALTLGADGNIFDVTGTTTITSINSVAIGTIAFLHFNGALTLTHHATDLICRAAQTSLRLQATRQSSSSTQPATGDASAISGRQASHRALNRGN